MDEPFEHGLAGVGLAVAEDVFDLFADLGGVAGCGTLWWLVELELELGFAVAELLDPFLESGQASADVVVLVVEGALFEGGQVAVDAGVGLLQLANEGGELVAVAGGGGAVGGLELGDGSGDGVGAGVEVEHGAADGGVEVVGVVAVDVAAGAGAVAVAAPAQVVAVGAVATVGHGADELASALGTADQACQIAEVGYTAFAGTKHESTARLIVRRVKRLDPIADHGRTSCSPAGVTTRCSPTPGMRWYRPSRSTAATP